MKLGALASRPHSNRGSRRFSLRVKSDVRQLDPTSPKFDANDAFLLLMNSKTKTPDSIRNLRTLLLLGVVITLVASVGGGLILTLGYRQADVTQPIWKFGQYVMILGLMNLGIYSGVLFQLRGLAKALHD